METPATPPPPPPLLLIRLPGPEAVALLQEARTLATDDDAARLLQPYQGGVDVTPAQLRAAYGVLQRAGQEAAFATTVLQGARPVFPRHDQRKAEAAAASKAKEVWRRQLLARHQQREYNRMVKNVHWGGAKKPDPETRPFYQASIAFNMLAAMITAGFLGYYVAGSFLDKDAYRLMVGTVTAMSMLVVEMTLYIIRTTEVERFAPKRERNEQLGQKGMTIPTGPLDDIQFLRSRALAGSKSPPPQAVLSPQSSSKQKLL